MQQPSARLTAIILTKDEEVNIERAIASIRRLGGNIFIVDSGSADRTVEIAKGAGCAAAHHPWTNYAQQFRWAMENCPYESDWYMRLDADEYLSDELIGELTVRLSELPPSVHGLNVRLRIVFMGKWLRHGGLYPLWIVRFWRRGCAEIEQVMDEHMVIRNGDIHRLTHDLIEDNRKDLAFWTDKHNRYSGREAADVVGSIASGPGGLSREASRRRFLKANVYYRLPLFIRALLYFFYRYVIRFGFLDGTRGYLYHFLQAYWYRTLVDAKIYETILNENERRP